MLKGEGRSESRDTLVQGRDDVDDAFGAAIYPTSYQLLSLLDHGLNAPPPLSSGYNLFDHESQWLVSLHLRAAPRDYPALVPVAILDIHSNFIPFGISLGLAQLVRGDVQVILRQVEVKEVNLQVTNATDLIPQS